MTPDNAKVEAALAGIQLMANELRRKCKSGGVDCEICAWHQVYVDTLTAALAELSAENAKLREIATAFWPVMQSMRPLVLNLERLKDAAMQGESHD